MKPRIRLRSAQAFQGILVPRSQLGLRSHAQVANMSGVDTDPAVTEPAVVEEQERNAFIRHRDWWNARQKQLGSKEQLNTAEPPQWAKLKPTKLFCKARLNAAMNPTPPEASTSTSKVRPDPLEVLPIVQATYDTQYFDILEPQLADIAFALHLPPSTNWQPAEQRKVAQLLAYCWSRSYELDATRRSLAKAGQAPSSPTKETDVRRCAEYLAIFLIREAASGDISRASGLYEVLKTALEGFRRRNQAFFLPTPFMAALTVCRARAGITKNFKLDVRWPDADKAVNYIAKVLDIDPSAAVAEYKEAAERLLELRETEVVLPSGIWQLRKQLKHFAEMRDYQSRIDTWRAFRNKALLEKDETPDTLFDPKIRLHVLGAFLQSVLTPAANRHGGVYSEIEKCSAEVLEMIPKPYPRDVIHTLLARRAGVSQSEVTSPNPDSTLPDRKGYTRDQASGIRGDMERIWSQSEKSGRDIKMYLIYMEALGRLGSLRELQEVWNQLVNDKKARELYLEEETEQGAFPPTRALNHMISASLLVPGGRETAQQLFEQACRPDSTIPIDIVTINTMLRHHARKDQIAQMTDLFALSQKRNITPDVVTYTTLLQGLLRSGQFDMARKVMSSMANSGVDPNPRMCSMLVADLAKAGDSRGLEAAEEMMREMRRLRMTVGEVTWTALISGYFRGGWVQDAWEGIRRMEADGVKFNRVGYNLILKQAGSDQKKIGQKGESWPVQLYRKMRAEGIMPNSDTFVILLDGLCRTERWQEADKIVAEMGKMDFAAEKGSLVAVLKRVRLRRMEAKKGSPYAR